MERDDILKGTKTIVPFASLFAGHIIICLLNIILNTSSLNIVLLINYHVLCT